jgi:hypothetical protein
VAAIRTKDRSMINLENEKLVVGTAFVRERKSLLEECIKKLEVTKIVNFILTLVCLRNNTIDATTVRVLFIAYTWLVTTCFGLHWPSSGILQEYQVFT